MARIRFKIDDTKKISNENIPYIIGITLMGTIIAGLVITIIVCFCLRKRRYTINPDSGKKEYMLQKINEVEKMPLKTEHNLKYMDNRQCIPLPNIEKFDHLNNTKSGPRYISNCPRRIQCRRASMPVCLSTLHEVSASKESSFRKKSLSNECFKDIIDLQNRRDTLLMPESGPPTADTTKTSIKYEFRMSDVDNIRKIKCNNRYSIYDDKNLTPDDKFVQFGKLHFSLFYDIDAKSLEITIKKAQHLNGMRYKGKNKFYVKMKLRKKGIISAISNSSLSGIPNNVAMKSAVKKRPCNDLGSNKRFRTSIKSDFCNPNFEETFQFTGVTVAILHDSILEMLVKEETPKFLEKNRNIGLVELVLSEARLIEGQESITDLVRDIQPVDHIESTGSLTIALRYSKSQSLLYISEPELNLNKKGQEVTGPYLLEFYLRSIDTVIENKKLSIPDTQSTSLIEAVQNKEAITFNLDHCFLNSVCLVIVVFAKVRNCPKTPCGRIILGPIRFTDGSGLSHWADMSVGTDEPVTRSHMLY